MPTVLTRKLDAANTLNETDRAILERLSNHTRHVEVQRVVVGEGNHTDTVHFIVEGFACRYQAMPDGSRQITALLLPGDFCDLDAPILGETDHSIETLSPCVVAEIPGAVIRELMGDHPRINRALWWAMLLDEAILRQWLIGLGRLPAAQRMAHFFCETLLRMRRIGLTDGDNCPLPLSQTDLADILGLTSVHVNRMLQELRDSGLITLKKRWLQIHDFDRLSTYCGFTPSYLQLTPRSDNEPG